MIYTHATLFLSDCYLQLFKKYIWPTSLTNGVILGNKPVGVSRYEVEVCMGMGKTGIPWVPWDSHGNRSNISHGMGMGWEWELSAWEWELRGGNWKKKRCILYLASTCNSACVSVVALSTPLRSLQLTKSSGINFSSINVINVSLLQFSTTCSVSGCSTTRITAVTPCYSVRTEDYSQLLVTRLFGASPFSNSHVLTPIPIPFPSHG